MNILDSIPTTVWVLGAVALLIASVTLVLFFWSSRRRRSLLDSGSLTEKPEWMATDPPAETVTATQADGEKVSLYDYDPGERLAAPFAEQVEDIVRNKITSDPTLSSLDIDLGTASDGGLEIWVNGQCYHSISELPDARLREIFNQAIDRWEQSQR